jgi:hypothetical protein
MQDDDLRMAALRKVLRVRDELLLVRLDVRRRLNAVMAEDRAIERQLEDLRAAGRVFDQHVAVPRENEAYASLDALKAVMRDLRGGEDWIPGQSEPATLEQIRAARERRKKSPSHDVFRAREQAVLLPEGDVHEDEDSDPSRKASIRDLALGYLQLHEEGLKAEQIRQWLFSVYGIRTHDKTVGMTLYRLSKEGLVHREGHTWFPGSGSPETENPGGETPGLFERDEKEGGIDG